MITLLRRSLLWVVPAGFLTAPAWADNANLRAERSIGSKAAKTVVVEFFSLTCPHCARFAKETMPDVKKNLIDTGQVRWVFSDYPIGEVAMTAALVARYMPIERYEGFVNKLFATQNRWSHYNIDPADAALELWAIAREDGMSREIFDKATGDTALYDWLARKRDADGKKYLLSTSPTFLIAGRLYTGAISYEALRKALP